MTNAPSIHMVSATQPQLAHSREARSSHECCDDPLNREVAWCESRPMTSTAEALRSIARPTPPAEPSPAAPIIAIVRLRESRRSWFITAVCERQFALEITGYAPGCMHSPGRWFSLQPDFFEVAAS